MPTFRKETTLPVTADEAFAWHERPGALERLLPPWEPVRVVDRRGGIRDGDTTVLELRKGPFRKRWVAAHHGYVPGRQFADEQVSGPFARWEHVHRFRPAEPHTSVLEDEVHYRLPLGSVGQLLAGAYTTRTLERMFDFRHAQTLHDLTRHAAIPGSGLRVVITGASGMVGRSLAAFLSTGGHEVVRLVRRAPVQEDEIRWSPDEGEIDAAALEGFDAVVHLAGENIFGRWTKSRRRAILGSRTTPTRLLAETLSRLDAPPRVLVAASAIGYYGDRGNELLSEEAAPGDDFLARVCTAWEAASQPAAAAGIRVVNLRTGIVLRSILDRAALPFRLGLGGRLGRGNQWWSWIAFDDLVGAIHHALLVGELEGPVNVCAPNPVTNRELTKTLGGVLRRPTVIPVPAPALRLGFGQLADAVMLASQRVSAAKLEASGFRFLLPDLETALRFELGRP
jgi:uncharacterized protein (TIGR01777 family)